MKREAFRQRMQQYKQARENNPQLKYWDWKKYADGGIVDEDPPQNTSERPITNFDPKGDPYNPTQKSYMNTLREYMFKTGMINNIGDKVTSRQIKKVIRSLPKDMRSIEAAYLQFATPGQYTKWFNKIPLLGTYPIVNKQFQNYEEDKDKAREQR